MDENLAYWSASFNEQENGSLRPSPLVPMLLPTWPSDSPLTCLAYMIVQDVTNLLLLTTWWAHNPQFHRIETWLSCTPLFLKLILMLGFIWKSQAAFREAIYSGTIHNTYSHCSEPVSPSVSGNELLPTRLKLLIAPSYLALDDFLEFELERCLYATFT